MQGSFFSICGQALLEVLAPIYCPTCEKKLVDNEHVICQDCLDSIARTEHAVLADNGIDMLFAALQAQQKHTIHYERGAAFAYYNRDRGIELRRLIERGKFGLHPRPDIFEALGKEAARDYIDSDLFEEADLLVPIPLHSRRLRERGFNQAEHICIGLQSITHIPIDNQHFVRTRNNPHQSRSVFRDRQKNVENLFAVLHPEDWKGKHILLVDDVITSGATMMACMRAMAPIRGCKVSVFALGWAHS